MVRDPMEFIDLALGGAAPEAVPPDSGPALSLHAQARLVGGCHWVERRLYEILGTWVESESSAEAQLLFDVYSQQHAWHAGLFAERLPVSHALAGDVASALADGLERMFDILARGASDGGGIAAAAADGRGASAGTLLRLAGLSRVVLPRLVAGFTLHLRRGRPVADAALLRAVRLTMRDEIEEWQVLEALVQSLVRGPHDVEVVTAHQARLEAVVAGGEPGLVPWPGPDHGGGAASSEAGVAPVGRTGEGSRPTFSPAERRSARTPTAERRPGSPDGTGSDGPDSATAQVTAAGATAPDDRRP